MIKEYEWEEARATPGFLKCLKKQCALLASLKRKHCFRSEPHLAVLIQLHAVGVLEVRQLHLSAGYFFLELSVQKIVYHRTHVVQNEPDGSNGESKRSGVDAGKQGCGPSILCKRI